MWKRLKPITKYLSEYGNSTTYVAIGFKQESVGIFELADYDIRNLKTAYSNWLRFCNFVKWLFSRSITNVDQNIKIRNVDLSIMVIEIVYLVVPKDCC